MLDWQLRYHQSYNEKSKFWTAGKNTNVISANKMTGFNQMLKKFKAT